MILVLGTPRSGSSLTAGIFAAHGVWTGTCREGNDWNPKGFFENRPIKNLLIRRCGAIVHQGRLADPIPGIENDILGLLRSDGYEDGPWLWKGSALYHPVWRPLDPIVVCARRDIEATVRSCRDSAIFGKDLTGDRLREIIRLHHDEMDRLGGFDVDTKAVAHGDFATIKCAIEGAGLEFDENKARDFVEPRYWRH